MGAASNVVVIGGGITGTAAAYELARRGVSVTLLERGTLHAMGSGWSLAGVRQSGRHPAELPLAIAAIRRWQRLHEELGADIEYRRSGNLRLALREDDVATIQQVVTDGQLVGLPIRYIDGVDEIREIAPLLTEYIAGASFCESDGHANNHRTVQAYADAAQRMGAIIRTSVDVTGIAAAQDRVVGVMADGTIIPADTVIVAAGIYSPRLLEPLGFSYPITITLCPVIQSAPSDLVLEPVLGVAGGNFAGRQEANGRFRIIGQSEPWPDREHNESNTGATIHQLEETIAQSLELMPSLKDLRLTKTWGGLIDMTPDALPVLDRIEGMDGLVVGSGFSGHGFGIGPVSGEILADLATGREPAFDIDAFRLERFARGEYVDEEALLHG